MTEFVAYYNDGRPNQGIAGVPRYGADHGPPQEMMPPDKPARLVARPVLGGLIHDYQLAA